MQALIRMIGADLKSRWLQHGLILVVVAVTAGMLTLTLVIYRSAVLGFERTFRAANGAHVWFAGSTAGDLEGLRTLDGVTEANAPFPTVWGPLTVELDGERDALALWGVPAEQLAVGRPVVVDGRWLAAGATDEIVLDQGLARLRSVAPGDRIEVHTREGMSTLIVVGVAVNAARPAYPASSPALGYVLPDSLARLEPDSARWGWMLGVRLFSAGGTPLFIERARAAYPAGAAISATPWHWVRDEVNDSTFFNVLFLGVFGAFALMAAGCVIATMAGGQIAARVREVGLLKAAGFTPAQVTLLFVAQQAVLAGVAASAGAAGAVGIAQPFLADTATILGATPATAVDWPLLAGVMVGLTLVAGLVALMPAWRGGRVPAAQALTTGFAATAGGPTRLAGWAARVGLPPVLVLGLKEALQRRGRAALTIGSAAVAVVTATFTLSSEATLQAALKDPTVIGGAPYVVEAWRVDFVTGRADLPAAEAERLLAEQPGVLSAMSLVNVAVRWLPKSDAAGGPGFMSFAVGGDYNQFRFHIPEGRMFAGPGEAILSGALADELGVALGDEITLMVMAPANGVLVDSGRTLTVRYVGRYAASGDGGRRLLYSLETYQQQAAPEAEPERYGLKLAPGGDADAIAAELMRASGGRLEVNVTDARPGVEAVRGSLWALTSALLAIAAINLLATLWLGVREQQRDFAILKTAGVTPAQIAWSVLVGSGVLAAAAAVGVPMGVGLTRSLFDVIAEALNLGRGFFALPHPMWLLGLVPLTILVAALGAALPARLAAGVRVVEALRAD